MERSGLWIEDAQLAAHDPDAPLTRRVLFGIRIMMLLFAVRALIVLTGADHISHLFNRFDAAHILLAGPHPMRLVALSMPVIAAAVCVELELRVVQPVARLLPKATEKGGRHDCDGPS
jgi:hypothetical protein